MAVFEGVLLASNQYHFETLWRVQATIDEVSDILAQPLCLPRWWPQVYLSVRETEPGVYALHTKGWLPYHLTWKFHVVESRPPYGFKLHAWGDLEGTGVWKFVQNGDYADVHYDWTVNATKPILRYLSCALKPIFSANHRWAMARGYESLLKELARRRSALK